jgi:hypothetical protein
MPNLPYAIPAHPGESRDPEWHRDTSSLVLMKGELFAYSLLSKFAVANGLPSMAWTPAFAGESGFIFLSGS